MLAFGSDVEERKTTDGKKKEGMEDRESRDVSRGSPSWAEPAAPSADYKPKENTKKPVVPSMDEGHRLREAGCECQPRFRRSVADAGKEEENRDSGEQTNTGKRKEAQRPRDSGVRPRERQRQEEIGKKTRYTYQGYSSSFHMCFPIDLDEKERRRRSP
ncbi:hypothetical protein NDU88_001012 [Pleurodeles waltl]|uniref:Uncharacterized protein n=1 Tax=Pleurodeles waltl TaxID=8319 RepID=A0AAV7P2H0_PLEWA|nr:hypothetical protein NDU88_001012 [Pleurodeles waltl]